MERLGETKHQEPWYAICLRPVSFVTTYKAPFSAIPALSFMTASLTYNSAYNWERGTAINGVETGHSIYNQSSWNVDGRINLEQFYNKFKYPARSKTSVSATRAAPAVEKKPKRFERTIMLKEDTTVHGKAQPAHQET